MRLVTVIKPVPVEPTVSISGLTMAEYDAILACLRHCSSGHIVAHLTEFGQSIPGMLYNDLSAAIIA